MKIISKELAKQIRLSALEMVNLGGSSHIGSILSVADIIAVLYASIMKYEPKNPKMIDRDRLILSKGHAGAIIYAALAKRRETKSGRFRRGGSALLEQTVLGPLF